MTAWQDEPPLTRRQIRMRERGVRDDVHDERAEKGNDVPQAPRLGWDADARHTVGHHSQQQPDQSHDGQSPDGQPHDGQPNDFKPDETPRPYAIPPAAQDGHVAYRPRDFSPAARPEPFFVRAGTARPAWTPPTPAVPTPAVETPATETPVVHEPEVHSPPALEPEAWASTSEAAQGEPVTAPSATPGVAAAAELGHVLTRRELRRQRGEFEAPVDDYLQAQSEAAVVERLDGPHQTQPSEAQPSGNQPSEVQQASVRPELFQPEPIEPELIRPELTAPAAEVLSSPARQVEMPSARQAPAEAVSQDFVQIMSSPSIDTSAVTVIPVAPTMTPLVPGEFVQGHEDYSPPFGHWSTQAKLDDENQILDHSVRRDLSTSSGAITTSALVLPSVPRAADITRPISSTGEILITGTIDLPSSLGSTGSYPTNFDRSDVDAIIAADDREDSATDSAPVRAIRAVSTSNATPGMIGGKKSKESRLPLVLPIVASAIGVGVIVLFVIGYLFKAF